MLRIDPAQLANALLHHPVVLLVHAERRREQQLVVFRHQHALEKVHHRVAHLDRHIDQWRRRGLHHQVVESRVAGLHAVNQVERILERVFVTYFGVHPFDEAFELFFGAIGDFQLLGGWIGM